MEREKTKNKKSYHLTMCSQLLSNAIDSPAPVFGDFNCITAPVPVPFPFRDDDPLFERPPGVGGNPTTGCAVSEVAVVVVVVVVVVETDAFESKSRIVSRTLDLRVDVVVAVVKGCLIGDPSSPVAVDGLPPRDDLTGLGLVPNFASNLLGREIGLGIRDLTPPFVRDPFLPPEVVLVATLVVVEVARLLFEELPPDPQTQPLCW